jgi:chromosomal replication initiator protein
VIDLVCEKMNISREQLHKKTRQRKTLVARQVAMAFTREFAPHLSLAYIGSEIGGKDHATVSHSIKVVNDCWMHDKVYGYGIVVTEIHNTLKDMKKQRKENSIAWTEYPI